ncbi:DUF7269 family protein [Natronobiforma cellulositropha]|uniref:DUF7269 family protein n=1 Tax=Natronobiforma cellulositropha TaxID=1679076 RepID=UPI0021D5FF46|nr:hypothetical protein [Natronobiforma cellulositropha]
MSRTTVGYGVALGLAVLGFAVAFVPGIDASVTLSSALLTWLGLLALVVGAFTARAWLRTDARTVRPEARERRRPMATPGDEFDRRLAAVRPAAAIPARYERDPFRERVLADLESTALDVLERHDSLSRDEAEARLRSGQWCADPLAASCFTPGDDATGPSAWAADTVGERTAFERQVDRVVDELERRSMEAGR